MTLGSKIAELRKEKGMTQEALANALGVSNQAVSKWESEQSCPDIQLLPQIADIFKISLDDLFERTDKRITRYSKLPWEDDGVLRIVAFVGHQLIKTENCIEKDKIIVEYQGEALDISSDFSVQCDTVHGNVNAGTYVKCGCVTGCVDAGADVECENVGSYVNAGGAVACGGDVNGNVDAGGAVSCGRDVNGNVDAGGAVACGGDVNGNVDAGGDVTCSVLNGTADVGGAVTCDVINGNIEVGSCVTCDVINGNVNAGAVTVCDGGINGTVNTDGN